MSHEARNARAMSAGQFAWDNAAPPEDDETYMDDEDESNDETTGEDE